MAGFGPEQQLTAWSMPKSVFHALFGIAVCDGKLKTSDVAPVPARHSQGDPRGENTPDACRHMRSGIDYGDGACRALPRKRLFGNIGMRGACFETDATGVIMGSSCLFATARHFVRFGLLCQNDGSAALTPPRLSTRKCLGNHGQ